MSKRYIIAIVGGKRVGKTPAIKHAVMSNPTFYNSSYRPTIFRSKNDIWQIGDYNKKKLSICSAGDFVKVIERVLKYSFDTEQCDIVVLPCHPYDFIEASTLEYIRKYAHKNNIALIETSMLHFDDKQDTKMHTFLNDQFSKQLWELIDTLQ